ncbi:STAS domain-containing protein [Bacillus salitolerans]|uniref:Anti-sigma factor antagonist n=1 Tax=Bacillus salitolerans TaxID=1437434 RepID=A0ABW4LRA0_9BACI
MNLQIDIKKSESINTVVVKGEIDAYTAPQLKGQLDDILLEEEIQLIIDLHGVSYIDSTGLGVLVSALKITRQTGGSLKLTGVNDRINRLLKITGLHEIMDISGGE